MDPQRARELKTRLGEWAAIPGISGHEDAVIRRFAEALRPHARQVTIDKLGNVIAWCGRADAPTTIALCAHLDTVGLMIKHRILPGIYGVITVGGANLKALPGAHVRVQRPDGVWIEGAIGVRSQHLAQPGDTAVSSIEEVYVQVDPALTLEAGSAVIFAPQTTDLGDCWSSPALDDRAGCVSLLEFAGRLAESQHNIALIGTVQEETTCMGARAAMYAVQPDAALFIDGCIAYDTPETQKRGSVALGLGAVLIKFLYVSGLNGWHAHPALFSHLKAAAQKAGIPVQHDAQHGIMSDARAAALEGIPSAVIGIPMRGKHSPAEVINLADLESVIVLMQQVVSLPLPSFSRG